MGDLNGDSFPDLVFGVADSNDVWVMLGRGDGTFQASTKYAAGHLPYGVAVADFNGDGKLDIAAANAYGGAGFNILLGNGDGTFRGAVAYNGDAFGQVIPADLNGDGILDLALGAADNVVGAAIGRGDGTFEQVVAYRPGNAPSAIAVGDFNGDGTVDIAVIDFLGNNVHLLSGNGDGTFRISPLAYQTTGVPESIVSGALTNGGMLDLVG